LTDLAARTRLTELSERKNHDWVDSLAAVIWTAMTLEELKEAVR
jgi:hypothetical protein